MNDNKEFYNRILNGQETIEDLDKFDSMCASYSDMYKDIYGVRPRDSETMCVNGYSGSPSIEGFRNLLKQGINPFEALYRAYDEMSADTDNYIKDCEERDFFEGNPSKDEILASYPEYKKYFTDDDFEEIYQDED